MPISPWPDRQIETWLAALDHTDPKELRRNFGQRPLRRWKNTHPNHRSFTVVHHPGARAYDVFCRHILPIKDDRYAELRRGLRRVHNLPLPEHPDDPPLSTTQLRACFCEFLKFLKFNLAGQTALRVDGAWASQSQIIQGFCKFAPPHMIVRAETFDPAGWSDMVCAPIRTATAGPSACGNLRCRSRNFGPRGLCCGLHKFWV